MRIIYTLLLFLFICSCSKKDPKEETEEIIDTRFKFTFTSADNGVIFGDQSNKILKKFSFSNSPSNESKYYYNEQSNTVYIAWIQDNGTRGRILSKNILDIYNYQGNNAFIDADLTIVPNFPDENLIDIVVDADENVLAFYASTKVETGTDVLIVRKIKNDTIEIMLTIPFFDTYYVWENLHYLPNSNEVLYFNNSSEYPILIDLNTFKYESLFVTTSVDHCESVVFGNTQEKFLIDSNNAGTGPHSQTLYSFNGESHGTIYEEGIYDLYFIGCRASIGYDNVDRQFEYVLSSNGRSSIGELNVNEFGLIEENIVGNSYTLSNTGNPLFFFSID